MKLILIVMFIFVAANAEQKSFVGYKLYKVIPENENAVKTLESMRDSGHGDFWNEYFNVKDDIRIMVSPEKQKIFLEMLSVNSIKVETIIEDVQKVVENQLNPTTRNRQSTSFHSMSWDLYYNLDQINVWLDELVAAYPNVVSTIEMGISNEERVIRGIKIDYKPDRTEKKIGVIEGTLHAREWITTATVTWIIKEFLTSTDPAVRSMAEDLEWHIFPVVNPDGYVYTFTNHRMWRKNRSTANFTSCAANGVDDDMSNGVDLNRNFDFFWMSIGASDNPCTNTFAGPSPNSEPETRAIVQYVSNLKQQGEIIYYLSFHSYTQLIIIPYSHITSVQENFVDNYADMFEIAMNSAVKISQRYNTTYRVGISADILYPLSGSSFDWVKYNVGVPVSYLIELRDLGEFGFLLPAEQIIPNCLEMMDGLVEMDRSTRALGYYSGAVYAVVNMVTLIAGLVFLLMSR